MDTVLVCAVCGANRVPLLAGVSSVLDGSEKALVVARVVNAVALVIAGALTGWVNVGSAGWTSGWTLSVGGAGGAATSGPSACSSTSLCGLIALKSTTLPPRSTRTKCNATEITKKRDWPMRPTNRVSRPASESEKEKAAIGERPAYCDRNAGA